MTEKPTQLKVEYVSAASFTLDPTNPRGNGESGAGVVKSAERHGSTNLIVAGRSNRMVLAGHTWLKALKAMGGPTAPMILLDMTAKGEAIRNGLANQAWKRLRKVVAQRGVMPSGRSIIPAAVVYYGDRVERTIGLGMRGLLQP